MGKKQHGKVAKLARKELKRRPARRRREKKDPTSAPQEAKGSRFPVGLESMERMRDWCASVEDRLANLGHPLPPKTIDPLRPLSQGIAVETLPVEERAEPRTPGGPPTPE